MTTSIADLIARLRRAVDTGYVLRSSETRALLDALTAQEAELARLREALGQIRDGYGPNHMSKYARDVAARTLSGGDT